MNATLRGQGLSGPGGTVAAMSPDDLLGLVEIAELLDVSQSTAKLYARRPGFPEPTQLARGRVWRRRDVDRWASKTLPLRTGRPPKQR